LISDNFTSLGGNPTITEIGCALNNSFGGLFIFAILISLVFVIGFGIFSWNKRDFFGSFLYALSFVTTLSFFLTLTSGSNCTRMLLFDQFIFFLVLTVLAYITKKVID
jgi:hypothetical protein